MLQAERLRPVCFSARDMNSQGQAFVLPRFKVTQDPKGHKLDPYKIGLRYVLSHSRITHAKPRIPLRMATNTYTTTYSIDIADIIGRLKSRI
jgi:hypothetical protein